MAFNMPQIPQYQDRSPQAIVDPNRNQPLARRSDYYAQNPWEDPGYDKFGSKVGGAGMGFLNRAGAMDPTKAGGFMSDPSTYMARFGINNYDPLNPRSRAQMGAGMANLRGGTQNMLQAGVKDIANAGVAAGRGGFGVTGGAGPEATAQQALIKQLAQQYGGDYTTIAGLLNQGAGVAAGAAGDYARSYADILGKYLGAGTGLTAQELQAITGKGASQDRYRSEAGAAYGADVNEANQWQMGAPDRAWQERMRNQQWQDQQTERDRRFGAEAGLRGLTNPANTAYPGSAGGYAGVLNKAMMDRYDLGMPMLEQGAGGGGSLAKRPGLNRGQEQWLGRNAYTY